jgi:hypothetical protein
MNDQRICDERGCGQLATHTLVWTKPQFYCQLHCEKALAIAEIIGFPIPRNTAQRLPDDGGENALSESKPDRVETDERDELMEQAAKKAEEVLTKIDFHADDLAYQVLVTLMDLIAEQLDYRRKTRENYDALWKLIYDQEKNGSWDYPGQIIVHMTQFIKEKDELIAILRGKGEGRDAET